MRRTRDQYIERYHIDATCNQCGKTFSKCKYSMASWAGMCVDCSRGTDRAESFWKRVLRGDGCWEWRGSKNRHGYGLWADIPGGPRSNASRWAWSYANNAVVPDGLHVCHTCDNRLCCNPEHLYVGTPADNVRDRTERFVSSKGCRSGAGKLDDPHAVGWMFSLRRDGWTQKQIAESLGVTQSTVSLVLLGKVRAHQIPVEFGGTFL